MTMFGLKTDQKTDRFLTWSDAHAARCVPNVARGGVVCKQFVLDQELLSVRDHVCSAFEAGVDRDLMPCTKTIHSVIEFLLSV